MNLLSPIANRIAWMAVSAILTAPLWADEPATAGARAASPASAGAQAASDALGHGVDRDAPDFVTASLLVIGPGDELYSCAGHAALRMECPTYGLDYCFSYESESVGDKVLAFFRGKLKMGMFAVPTETFLSLYRESGRGVRQYALDLPPAVETRLWKLLDDKVAEGAELPYEFLERGCAQAMFRILIEAVAPTQLDPGRWPEPFLLTRREIVDAAVRDHFPWNRFFLYSLVGVEADREVTNQEKVVTPDVLRDILGRVRIAGVPVISGPGVELLPETRSRRASRFPPPIAIAWLVLAVAVANLVFRSRAVDFLFVAVQTLAGCFFAYLVFVSNLPATGWNWLLVPFNPLPALLWKSRGRWSLAFAFVLLVWEAGMLLSPHRLADPAYLVLVAAYFVFYVRIPASSGGGCGACSKSEIGMRTRTGEGQNKDVIVNAVQKHPVVFDVAIPQPGEISGEGVVSALRGERFALCEHFHHCGELSDVFAALQRFTEVFPVARGLDDAVFHDSMNSSILSGSVQHGAVGSRAICFASSNASRVKSWGVFRCLTSWNGIPPTATHFLRKLVMAVVKFNPMSSKTSSASVLRSSSRRIVSVVVIAISLFLFERNECNVQHSECAVNPSRGTELPRRVASVSSVYSVVPPLASLLRGHFRVFRVSVFKKAHHPPATPCMARPPVSANPLLKSCSPLPTP